MADVFGAAGNDILTGTDTDDKINGLAGADKMAGADGNDTYYVDNTGDVVSELSNQGSDRVLASVTATLSANVEDLQLLGGADTDATGNALDNSIFGNIGNNQISGGAGGDGINARDGNDVVNGDAGDDVVSGAGGNDTVDGGTGNDYVIGGTGDDNLLGGAGDDRLEGDEGTNILKGGLGNDTYVAGLGFDTFDEAAGGGVDTIESTLDVTLVPFANIENLVLKGSADKSGQGNDLDNVIIGNDGKNNLTGGLGNDYLDGGLGKDHLDGGSGDDTYVVDNSGDVVTEFGGSGKDTVIASVAFSLLIADGQVVAGQVENLTLDGADNIAGTGNDLNNAITGNAGGNTLHGGKGDDTLVGGSGRDFMYGDIGSDLLVGGEDNDYLNGETSDAKMFGGKGDDSYVVDSLTDKITEAAKEGADTVFSSIDYVLGANLERLTLLGAAAINGTGNSLSNAVNGNSASNILDGGSGDDVIQGGDGDDTLVGGAGNDTLNGEGGADAMTGGTGNDVYFVDDVGDTVIEIAKGGVDEIMSSLSFFNLGDSANNVEKLTLTGIASIHGTGGSIDNIISGNDGANILNGAEGNDKVYGGGADDVLIGSAGNDLLDGGAGNDEMSGGDGDDVYSVDSKQDTVDESGSTGKDTVLSFIDFSLLVADGQVSGAIENLVLSGKADIRGTGNDLANTLIGNEGRNTLEGGAGADTLKGGSGNDTYILSAADAADKIVENSKEGFDTVVSSLGSYTLGANLEELQVASLGGTGTGNTLDNLLIGGLGGNKLDGGAGNDNLLGDVGNDTLIGGAGDDVLNGDDDTDLLLGGAGNDILSGGTGDDAMEGGAGNDIYVVDSIGDKVSEASNAGEDTIVIRLAATVDLANYSNVENARLAATFSGKVIGNASDNILLGNELDNDLSGGKGNDSLYGGDSTDTLSGGEGNDLLDGGSGGDYCAGGTGDDSYYVNGTDSVTEFADSGFDTVISLNALTTLAANVEKLVLDGNGNISGTGNDLANVLVGNDGANALDGGALGDTMIGGEGDDLYTVDDVGDKVVELASQGHDTVQSRLATYVLAGNVEDLYFDLTGVGATGTGNALDNSISGSDGKDKLTGGAGNDALYGNDDADTLIGGNGNDTLDGGAGADFLQGDAGDDTYQLADATDVIKEAANGGNDTIIDNFDGNIDLANYLNVENVKLGGTADLEVIAGAAANVITGNDGKNHFDVGAGDDVLYGGKGGDNLESGDGNDTVYGGADDDLLFGDSGNDYLDGGTGADIMEGASGNDTFIVDDAKDIVSDAIGVGGGTDLVRSSVSFNLAEGSPTGQVFLGDIENLTLTGADKIDGTGNALANIITGNDKDNVLSGGAGNDTLIGGAGDDSLDGESGKDQMSGGKGNDFYLVDNAGDKVTEFAGEGIDDTVVTTLSAYVLGANLEGLGFDASVHGGTGTGNALDNQITGSDGKDKLDGGSGNDHVFGNDDDDILIGGAGDDILDGNLGSDDLTGGAGNDVYYVETAGDKVHEALNAGIDIIFSTIDFDLSKDGANIENINLISGATAVGNDLNNVLYGSSFADHLAGGKGQDTLNGSLGIDMLEGGDGNDQIDGGLGTDTLAGGAGNDVFLYRVDSAAQILTVGGDVITDFEAGKDKIDIRDLFEEFGIGSGVNPFTDGFLKLETSGIDTVLKFDSDGGGNGYVTLATVTAATVAASDLVF